MKYNLNHSLTFIQRIIREKLLFHTIHFLFFCVRFLCY